MSASPPPASPQPQEERVEAEAGAELEVEAGPTQNSNLYNQIFGGDDSDFSESDAESGAPAIPKRKAFPSRTAADNDGEDDDDDDDHRRAEPDSDDDDDDERDAGYVPGTATSAAKIPKFKKRAAGDGDVDMDGEDEDEDKADVRKKKKKQKRRSETRGRAEGNEPDEEDNEVVDEATQRSRAIVAKIDGVGKKPKQTRKKKDDVDVVDTYHDEICARLREGMMIAVDKDRQSNEMQMPATAKLAMLDEVMSVLRNSTLWTSVVDNGVLEAVRAWLEPMEATAALPAVGIQSALFEVLPKMDLDTATLKESRLGPIVLFYTKTKRVTPAISRAADGLVQAWSRPIVKRPGDFRNRHEDAEGANGEGNESQRRSQGQSQGASGEQRRRRFDAAKAVKENHGRKGARMPQVKETQYTVAPASQRAHQEEDMAQVRRIANDNKKFNRFAKQMRVGKAK